MANKKVIDITSKSNYGSPFFKLSQTPKNYDTKNFYVKTLQDKVNAEWKYRVNRIDSMYEMPWGSDEFAPLEVVVQKVKTDTGTLISSDFVRLVFKNIREDRFLPGHKFLFRPFFKPMTTDGLDEHRPIKAWWEDQSGKWCYVIGSDEATGQKYEVSYSSAQANGDVNEEGKPFSLEPWLVINTENIDVTSSVVVQRCTNTLGSTYMDETNRLHAHYEPVIVTRDLSMTNFQYNINSVSQQSSLLIIAQHNEYTSQYFVNQRFIVGYDKVYRIKAINKFYANEAYDPRSDGLMNIYLEITESSIYDNFEKGLAYQEVGDVKPNPDINDRPSRKEEKKIDPYSDDEEDQEEIVRHKYSLGCISPKPMPSTLGNDKIIFKLVGMDNNDNINLDDNTLKIILKIGDLPTNDIQEKYIELEVIDNQTFSLKRKRTYLRDNLEVKCIATIKESLVTYDFVISLKGI